MVKPAADRTIVTIKGIDPDAWETAKRAAIRRGETQGEWLSRACLYLANLEANDSVLPGLAPAISEAHEEKTIELLKAMGAAGVAPNNALIHRANRLANLRAKAALPAPIHRAKPPQLSRSNAPRALPAPARTRKD